MRRSWRKTKSEILLEEYEDFEKRLREFSSFESYQVHALAALALRDLTSVYGELTDLSAKQAAKLGCRVRESGRKLWDQNFVLSMAFGFIASNLEARGLLPDENAQKVYNGTKEMLEAGKDIIRRNPIALEINLASLSAMNRPPTTLSINWCDCAAERDVHRPAL